jgi:hypothetical protein
VAVGWACGAPQAASSEASIPTSNKKLIERFMTIFSLPPQTGNLLSPKGCHRQHNA